MPRQLLIRSPEDGLPLEVPYQDLVEVRLLEVCQVLGHVCAALSDRSDDTYFKTNCSLTVLTFLVYENAVAKI